MRLRIVVPLALFSIGISTSAYAIEPVCKVNPLPSLIWTTVSIERAFDPDEVYVSEGKTIYGVRGTAWLLDEHTLATIEHVATGAKLSEKWKEVTLSWSDAKNAHESQKLRTRVRFKELVPGPEKLEYIALLELEYYLPGGKVAKVRSRPLERNEPVVGMGYKDNTLRFAQGRLAYPEPSGDGQGETVLIPLPYLPFELSDPEANSGAGDRYVFDHGSSGSPLFDCHGEVVAVVQALMTRTMTFIGNSMQVTTPWGMANVTGVSAAALADRQWKNKK